MNEEMKLRKSKDKVSYGRRSMRKGARGKSSFDFVCVKKLDSLMNWKPVKFYKGRSDMNRLLKRRKNTLARKF